jgi:hypothetical protein
MVRDIRLTTGATLRAAPAAIENAEAIAEYEHAAGVYVSAGHAGHTEKVAELRTSAVGTSVGT